VTDTLTIRYMRLDDAAKLRWRKNPKLHDIGAIVESIRRYGFIDPPGFDATLGAFTYGNGRDEALEWMYAQGEPLPRGILVADDGMWLMPVKVGLDQATAEQAEALALDHNNLTLSGGPFTAYDMARMWGDGYTEILASLATADALPITVDGDALDGLLQQGGTDILDLWRGMPEFEQEDLSDKYKSLIVHFATRDDYEAFAQLVNQTLTDKSNFIWYPYRPTHGVRGSMQGYTVEDES
jgi:hypothetical protein